MNRAATQHLSEDQILMSVVDVSDLPGAQQDHLATCPVCMAEKDHLKEMLLQVGTQAKASTPDVVRRTVLPDRSPSFLQKWFLDVRPLVRITVPALLVLIVAAAALVLKPDQDTHIAVLEEQMIDPEKLLSEMDGLIENPLPLGLQTMVSFVEIDPDEDFMETLVPVIENDPLSNIPGKKGENIC